MKKRTKSKDYIRVEPAEFYDTAIIKEAKDGKLTYSYHLLARSVMEEYGYEDIDMEQAYEWVDYNILPLQGLRGGFNVSYSNKHAT
jgi:hypothetical protein